MNRWKIGIIGLANFSHAKSYMRYMSAMPEVELVGIAERNKELAAPFIDSCRLPYYENYHDLLAQNIDAVIVCSENVFHAEMCIEAARAGKHILCEKPLGVTVPQMRKTIAAAAKAQVKLMTMLPSRYSASVWKAKKAIDSGEIGELVAINGSNRGKSPSGWYTDKELSAGGAIIDHTVHIAGIMNFLTGARIKEVYAQSGTFFGDKEVEDAGIIHATFDNGVIATLDPSWSRCKSYPIGVDVTMHIVGTKGAILLDNYNTRNELYSDDAMRTRWNYFGDNNPEYLIRDFIASLKEDKEVRSTGEDGLYASAVALAAYRSIELGEPVAMDELFK
jgi:predicted dehydrogenase